MIADLVTRKGAKIKDVTEGSEWVNGKPWMSKSEEEFPALTVGQIVLNATEKSELLREMKNLEIIGDFQENTHH